MKLFIVENNLLSIAEFIEAMGELHWSHYIYAHPKEQPADDKSVKEFLQQVCKEQPDAVLLDAAMTTKEEKLLDRLQYDGKEVSEDTLSGFKYCKALARERLGIPIVFLTQYDQGQVARTAMRTGADRVYIKEGKTTNNKDLCRDIEELVKAKTAHDPAYYWPMREKLDASDDMWQKKVMRSGLDRFFLNDSSVRRFGQFTAALRNILSPLFKGDGESEKKLILGLVKSQVLLSLVDPRLRDHVRHTGNVFWVGYSLLHEVREFEDPLTLNGGFFGGHSG